MTEDMLKTVQTERNALREALEEIVSNLDGLWPEGSAWGQVTETVKIAKRALDVKRKTLGERIKRLEAELAACRSAMRGALQNVLSWCDLLDGTDGVTPSHWCFRARDILTDALKEEE